jgi:hypothetical protein
MMNPPLFGGSLGGFDIRGMIWILFFSTIADSLPETPETTVTPLSTDTPRRTAVSAALHWGLIFGSAGVGTVIMTLLGIIAVYFMNRHGKREWEDLIKSNAETSDAV